MIWIYNSALVILRLNLVVTWPERLIFCPGAVGNLAWISWTSKGIAQLSSGSVWLFKWLHGPQPCAAAPRYSGERRQCQEFCEVGIVKQICEVHEHWWQCQSWCFHNLFKIEFFQLMRDTWFPTSLANSEVLRFAVAKPPEAKRFAAELCDSAMLRLNPPEVPASTCSISSVTDGRAVTISGLVISSSLSSKGNLLEWPDISGFKQDLKGLPARIVFSLPDRHPNFQNTKRFRF